MFLSYPPGMMCVMGEVEPVKLNRSVRAALRALADSHGQRLTISQVAKGARLSASTTRTSLATLEKGGLVHRTMLPACETRPPRAAYWLTGAGVDVALVARART